MIPFFLPLLQRPSFTSVTIVLLVLVAQNLDMRPVSQSLSFLSVRNGRSPNVMSTVPSYIMNFSIYNMLNPIFSFIVCPWDFKGWTRFLSTWKSIQLPVFVPCETPHRWSTRTTQWRVNGFFLKVGKTFRFDLSNKVFKSILFIRRVLIESGFWDRVLT